MGVASERPGAVRAAVVCLWISVGLALAITAAQVARLLPAADVEMTALIGLASAGLLALIAAMIGAGRGWARWLFAVVYAIGALATVATMLAVPQLYLAMPTLLQVSTAAQFALQTVALVLIFTGASLRWFADQAR